MTRALLNLAVTIRKEVGRESHERALELFDRLIVAEVAA